MTNWLGKFKFAQSFDEFIEQHQKGPLEREDYARAWVPIRQPLGTPNSVDFVQYTNSKGGGVLRWNDDKGIGRAILTIDDHGNVTDIVVQKGYRGRGLAQILLNHAKESGRWDFPAFEGPATPAGLKSLYRFIHGPGLETNPNE